jgi:hypothetical protein
MALKKKDDGFEAIRLEAEEAGINLTRGADGTFSAFIVGGASLDEYPDARGLLDDMLAVQEMDEKDDLYAYDNGPMGGYQVAVTGNPKPFESPTLAGALAMAKESLIPKPVEKTGKKTFSQVVTTTQTPVMTKTLNPNQPIMAQIDTDGGLIEDEAEILSPTKPNGAEAAQMRKDDLAETLAQGYLDLASLLTTFATTLRASPSTIPFVQKGFAEGEPAEETEAPQPARSRISRERRGK